jgi:drug/metabolite transporter (DMT)-like permease
MATLSAVHVSSMDDGMAGPLSALLTHSSLFWLLRHDRLSPMRRIGACILGRYLRL